MRVKAKLSRVEYDNRGKPIILFKRYCFYLAFAGLDGTFTVTDARSIPIKFTKDEFNKFFDIIELPEVERGEEMSKFIICYEKKVKGHWQQIWEIINDGPDAMHTRVEKLIEELNCDDEDIMIFDLDDQQ